MIIGLSTNNPHKSVEIMQILSAKGITGLSISTAKELLGESFEPEENGSTLRENAYIKAKALYDLINSNPAENELKFGQRIIPTIADDTGLFVEYLDGAPGVRSARYAGEEGDSELNRRKLLSELSGANAEERGAYFMTTLAYIDDSGAKYFDGKCRGVIISEERGAGGFGYDSIFLPEGRAITFAEMNEDEKNRISHRGLAVASFCEFLASVL